jgi:hypothetical protein
MKISERFVQGDPSCSMRTGGRANKQALFVILRKAPRKTFHLLEILRMLLTQSAYKMKVMVKMTNEPRHMHVRSRGTAPPIPKVTIR